MNNISLSDFKERLKLNSASNYRFYFKSPEPEFGFLKEEVNLLFCSHEKLFLI